MIGAIYFFASYEGRKKAGIPKIIWRDEHTSYDKSHYDFGHYGGRSVSGHHNYKARYYKIEEERRKKAFKFIDDFEKCLKDLVKQH